jgi:O-antigen ligase
MTAIGLLTVRQRGGRLAFQKKRPGPFLLVVAGVLLFTMTLAGLVLPMGVDLPGLSFTASGIRPGIWSSALEVFKEAPIGGVGASPYFAFAVDPLDPASPIQLWDAHNIYLSILGQFGLVGAALLGGAVVVLTSTLVRAGATRRHAVLLVALLAAAIHGIAIANEEFRHLWALVGLIGLAGVPQWAQGQWWKEEDLKESEGVTPLVPFEVSQE